MIGYGLPTCVRNVSVVLYVVLGLVAVAACVLAVAIVAGRRRRERAVNRATCLERDTAAASSAQVRGDGGLASGPGAPSGGEGALAGRRATHSQAMPDGAGTGWAAPQESHGQEQGSDTPRLDSKPALLLVESGPLAGQEVTIKAAGLTIGRLADNDVVLAGEPMISRHHAVIACEQGRHVLYDRDSANGTWVNEQRVFRHVLCHGDRIQIWQSRFAYKLVDTPVARPVTTVAPQAAPRILGEEFDGYRLERLIGRGGMSEVYRALDPSGMPVAIKILQVSDAYVVAKFIQEGNKIGPLLRLPSGAPHPNVAAVHKFDRSPDGRLYIVMEFVESPSLRALIGQPLAERDVVEIMGQVCSALQLAHENNIVHRDIKPENLLVSPERVVKVLDFGIAKLTSASTVTRDKIVGTPEYLSPEQARGDPVCPASDVYALGIVLYELLTGSVPFPLAKKQDPISAALTVIRQHLEERPEPPNKRNPSVRVAKNLERVALRALEKKVTDRYRCAGEMGAALGYRPHVATPAADTGKRSLKDTQARLVVLQGPRCGQAICLDAATTTIGRVDIEPSNVSISRQHACIICRGADYWIQDTSSNGTWVDSQRVYGEVPLRVGARITIGETVLQLVVD